MIQTKTVPTPELRTGDVVHSHGMRLEVGRVTERHGVWSTSARIINLDEVRTRGQVPAEWLKTGRWIIQGNRRAFWTVEA